MNLKEKLAIKAKPVNKALEKYFCGKHFSRQTPKMKLRGGAGREFLAGVIF